MDRPTDDPLENRFCNKNKSSSLTEELHLFKIGKKEICKKQSDGRKPMKKLK